MSMVKEDDYKTYEAKFNGGGSVRVKAANEWDARREAMRSRYGDEPTKIIPHAPNYSGYGLGISEVAA